MEKFRTIEKLLFYTAEYIDILPIFFFFLFFPKTRHSKGLWVICGYGVSAIFLLLIRNYLPENIQSFLNSSYILVEYLLFAWFIWLNISKKRVKFIIVIFSILFSIFIVIYASTVKIGWINSTSIGIESILILGFSFYFLYEQISDPKVLFIYNDYRFWIILGMMIFLAGTFFIYIFAEKASRAVFREYLWLTWVLSIIQASFFSIGILIFARKSVPKSLKNNQAVAFLDMDLN